MSGFVRSDHDRALAYLSRLGAKCEGCRHFAADRMKCGITKLTQSPHGLCLLHRPPSGSRVQKVTA